MEEDQALGGGTFTADSQNFKEPETCVGDDYADSAVCSEDSMPRFIDFCDSPACSRTFSFKSQFESIRTNQTACDICLGNVQSAAKHCTTCSASFCVKHLADHYKVPALSLHELANIEQMSKVPPEKESQINLSISDRPELRVVLLGKTGSGKSASGNTILGREAFTSEVSAFHCESQSGVVEGRNITVIDTPGLTSNEDAWLPEKEKASLVPHIFLLVNHLGKFTEKDNCGVEWIQRNFGDEALKFTIVLFTGGDFMDEQSEKDFLSNNSKLRTLIDCVEGRYEVFNNSSTDCDQVRRLIKKIDSTLVRNMGYVFTHEQLETMKESTVQEERKREKQNNVNKATLPGLWVLPVMICVVSLLIVGLKHMTQFDDPVNLPELRVMLLGKTGSGKSASGNIILGRKAFTSEASALPVRRSGVVEGRNITVIDTPGLTSKTGAAWLSEKEKASLEHQIFLLVINISKYTENGDNSDVGLIQKNFGDEALKFTMVLFTGGDLMDDKSVEEFLNDNSRLQTLVNSTGGGYHIFRNKHLEVQQHVKELLEKIEAVLRKNSGYSYSSGLRAQAETIARDKGERKRQKMEGHFHEGKILEIYDVMKRLEKGMEHNIKDEKHKAQIITNKTTTSKRLKKEATMEFEAPWSRKSFTLVLGLLSGGMFHFLSMRRSQELDLKLLVLCLVFVILMVQWCVTFWIGLISGVIGFCLILWSFLGLLPISWK